MNGLRAAEAEVEAAVEERRQGNNSRLALRYRHPRPLHHHKLPHHRIQGLPRPRPHRRRTTGHAWAAANSVVAADSPPPQQQPPPRCELEARDGPVEVAAYASPVWL